MQQGAASIAAQKEEKQRQKAEDTAVLNWQKTYYDQNEQKWPTRQETDLYRAGLLRAEGFARPSRVGPAPLGRRMGYLIGAMPDTLADQFGIPPATRAGVTEALGQLRGGAPPPMGPFGAVGGEVRGEPRPEQQSLWEALAGLGRQAGPMLGAVAQGLRPSPETQAELGREVGALYRPFLPTPALWNWLLGAEGR